MTPHNDTYPDSEIRLYRVTLPICNLCMQGIGQQCHVPGCAFWMSHPLDIADFLVESMEVHRCEILAGPLGYVAVCPCGWVSNASKTRLAAERNYTMLHVWEVLEDD